MNKIFNKFLILILFVLGIVFVPNYKANAAVTVTVYANPSTIAYGGSSKITWNSTGATSCIRTDTGASIAINDTTTGFTVSPTSTTTYTIHCIGAPATPSGFTASAGTCSSGMVSTNWSAVSGATGYILTNTTTGQTAYSGTNTYAMVYGLTYGSTYGFNVSAYDSDATSPATAVASATVANACAPTFDYYELAPCSGNPVYPTHYQTGPFSPGTYQRNEQRMGAISPSYTYFITNISSSPFSGLINIQTSGTGKTGCMP